MRLSIILTFLIFISTSCSIIPESGSCGDEITMLPPKLPVMLSISASEQEELINNAYKKVEGVWNGFLIDIENEGAKFPLLFTIERDITKKATIKDVKQSTKDSESEFKSLCGSPFKHLPLLLNIDSEMDVSDALKLSGFANDEMVSIDPENNNDIWAPGPSGSDKRFRLSDTQLNNYYVKDDLKKGGMFAENAKNDLIIINNKYYFVDLSKNNEP